MIFNNIKLPLNTDFSNITEIVAKKFKINKNDIISAEIYRKSVDARDKSDVRFCVSVIAELKNENKIIKKCKNALPYKKTEYVFEKVNSTIRPIIIGFGPAGIFAALTLAKAGLRPIVYERGPDVDTRTKDVNSFFAGGRLNPNSNVQFGEGGAGTFSDGKLNTGIKDERCRTVLETFYKFGAPKDILVDAKPHIGTDVLKTVIKNIRNYIISLGGEIHFNSLLDDIFFENGKLKQISVNGNQLPCEYMILCIGHSARDTFKLLNDNNVAMIRKPFAVGVRIEHLQEDINKAMYGGFANHPALKPADYKLAVHLENGRGVYTFCMCPGGEVINASSNLGEIAVNGMSNSRRDGVNANSAVLVNVNPEDLPDNNDVLAGCKFQQSIERKAFEIGDGKVPVTTVGEFVFDCRNNDSKIIPTVKPSTVKADFNLIFPQFIAESLKNGIIKMNKKIDGFASKSAVLTAPETRSSSPIRIIRNANGESESYKGIYPCGEGAGYAGGIMSAAVDGIKTAEKVIDFIKGEIRCK